ncbi:MAG: hypothetical protein AMJ72_10825 [Acidithiobacillales bacterium SM1_46]|nr:MAG: hypothetical protein AMJ72_10825 [Acidithiobacillales bacterium SM1_46]
MSRYLDRYIAAFAYPLLQDFRHTPLDVVGISGKDYRYARGCNLRLRPRRSGHGYRAGNTQHCSAD